MMLPDGRVKLRREESTLSPTTWSTAGPFLFDDLIAIESIRPAFVRPSLESADARKERQINDNVGETDG
jgi:hypothetical protein